MSTETSTVTVYGVARGEKLLSGGFDTIEGVQYELGQFEGRMQDVGLEPDVRVVKYNIETTVKTGRVRAYRAPEPEVDPIDEQPVDDGAPSA